MTGHRPVVLCLSGHDPTGGAGVHADIEAAGRLGCHAATVITALTVQDTRNVRRILPQAPADFLEQARTLVADLPIAAIKIGLLGSAGIAEAVVELLDELPGAAVVLDPILAAGGGRELASAELESVIRQRLLSRCTVATPNTPEARRLAGRETLEEAVRQLLAWGCPNVLLTGAHEEGEVVTNRWYSAAGVVARDWPRLPAVYHGSGCTLAAALAALLARGRPLPEAVGEAQHFTWNALKGGFAAGRAQWLPDRWG